MLFSLFDTLHRKKYIWIIIILSSSVYAQEIDLQGAILLALKNSPNIEIAQYGQVISKLEHKNAVAKLLPSVDLNATHSMNRHNVPLADNGSNSIHAHNALNLGVTETLYDNGAAITKISITKQNQQITAIKKDKAIASLILEVATAFYQYSLLNSLQTVKSQQVIALEKQFKLLAVQYRQGLKPKLDFLRFKAQVQRAKIDEVTAAKEKEQAEINLIKLLGLKAQDKPEVTFIPIKVKQDQNILMSDQELLVENTYDYRIKKTEGEIDKKNINLAQRKHWPQVFVYAGVNMVDAKYDHFKVRERNKHDRFKPNVMLSLKYNLWDWFMRKNEVDIAKNNKYIHDSEFTLNTLDLQAKLKVLKTETIKVQENYVLLQELLADEEENYRNIEEQYREAKVNYLDLITSLANLLEAKTQFYQAYFAALTINANYYFYEGTIYENLSQ